MEVYVPPGEGPGCGLLGMKVGKSGGVDLTGLDEMAFPVAVFPGTRCELPLISGDFRIGASCMHVLGGIRGRSGDLAAAYSAQPAHDVGEGIAARTKSAG